MLQKSTQNACHLKGYLANRIDLYTGIGILGQIESVCSKVWQEYF